MKLAFDPEDEKSFPSSRPEILKRFTDWLVSHGHATPAQAKEVAGDVGTALEWKWAYQDGDLAWWRVTHVSDFLLEWCPRSLSVDASECDGVREGLGYWFDFLNDENLFSSGADPISDLRGALAALRDDFLSAMSDSSKFGTAKTLFTLGSAEGVDMSDPEQIAAFIERFNDLSIDERKALLPDHLFAGPAEAPDRPFAPVIVPSDDEVSTSLAQAPIMAKFRDLAAFVDEGRRLTQKGHLTLADARVLVDLLDTGDEMDPRYANTTMRTTSSDDLSGLRLIVAWAKKAGVVRVVHGKLVATKRGVGLGTNPAKEYEHAIDALFKVGPLALALWSGQWETLQAIYDTVDEMSIDLLSVPLITMETVPVEILTDGATSEVLAEWRFGADDDTIRSYVASAVDRMIDTFVLAGLVIREGAVLSRWGTRFEGGRVTLTPVGVVTVRRQLIAAGFDVPVAGGYVTRSADQLFEALRDEDEDVVRAEVIAWCRARELAGAIGDVARAIANLDDPALQMGALEILGGLDVDVACIHVAELATRPKVAGLALAWLADHGLVEEKDLWRRAGPVAFVDVLVHRMLSDGPDGLVATLALVGDDTAQCAWLESTWRAPSLSVVVVLAGVDQIHPSKEVRKAARKALFKRRSSLGA